MSFSSLYKILPAPCVALHMIQYQHVYETSVDAQTNCTISLRPNDHPSSSTKWLIALRRVCRGISILVFLFCPALIFPSFFLGFLLNYSIEFKKNKRTRDLSDYWQPSIS